VLAEAVRVPASGRLVLRLTSRLERLWDFVYIEARRHGGSDWVALPSDRMDGGNPSGRNRGHGLSRSLLDADVVVDASAWSGESVDVAVRLVPHGESPRLARVSARLDPVQTLVETRRIIADDVRDTHYSFMADRAGLFAYGVTAVDVQGQHTDSEVTFVFIPQVTAVAVQDIQVQQLGNEVVLHWHLASSMPAAFVAWSRPLAPEETTAAVHEEWRSGRYRRAAARDASGPGEVRLRWRSDAPRSAVLLQGTDAESSRFWGPWVVGHAPRTRLHAAVPNPFNPRTRILFEVERSGPVTLDILSVDGRRVRRLLSGTVPAGSTEVVWDGQDDAGRPVASGVYVVTLRASGVLGTQRLVLLR
jgi:hypothetical protein